MAIFTESWNFAEYSTVVEYSTDHQKIFLNYKICQVIPNFFYGNRTVTFEDIDRRYPPPQNGQKRGGLDSYNALNQDPSWHV